MKHFRDVALCLSMTMLLFLVSGCSSLAQKQAVELLSDQLAIEEVMTELFVKTDERDWTAVETLFADKVQFDMTSLTGGKPKSVSPSEITAGWATGLSGIEAIHHQGGNYRVMVHQDEAEAKAYAIAYHYKNRTDHKNVRVFVGSYDYHFMKTAGKWKIDLFRFNLQFIDGNKNL